VRRFDLDEVQRRLAELHPDRELPKVSVKGPADPGDAPELPLFLGNDEDEPATPEDFPPEVIKRPALVVQVEDQQVPEAEVQLANVTLYDEEISFKPPTLALLVEGPEETSVDDAELQENARILQEKLATFRVKIENLTVQPGPVVTQYEFVPASGVKVSQIESLADDIALALKAPAVRIQAPVPGKGTVGIEIPNHKPALVRFSAIIKSPKYHNPDIKLPIALGKTAVGEVYCADLTKMPHLLIAGATGKGKSVGINTLIASLLYRMHPRDLKFVIIDPKRVEMTLYRELRNHYLALSPDIDETIITEPVNAVAVLKSVVEEMQMRYNILANAGQRNIADYNRKVKEGRIKDKDGFQHRPMPYIVVVIDELADLMMTAGKEVEEPIVRLAQLARAVGIHCVVATQRPSVDVVTGLIKANFPARIAYQVSARVDSRTILDTSGAEHLIGNGDMLFAPGNTPKPLRMQNAFISTEEVEALCEHIGKQRGYKQPYMLPSILDKKAGGFGTSDGERDSLFEDAARIFIQLQQASVSTLQRRLKVGYARAARIVDELESAGIVGPPDGSKGRAVLLQSESELEAYL
jgi:S-DNA-T family DNA segregation ATPase FtsK/SpoIIIE